MDTVIWNTAMLFLFVQKVIKDEKLLKVILSLVPDFRMEIFNLRKQNSGDFFCF